MRERDFGGTNDLVETGDLEGSCPCFPTLDHLVSIHDQHRYKHSASHVWDTAMSTGSFYFRTVDI